MALDMLVDRQQLETELTATANAIREKTGNTEMLEWLNNTGFADAIGAIETGGDIRIESGTVVLATDTTGYVFLEDIPDVCIYYKEDALQNVYSNVKGVWCVIQHLNGGGYISYVFGYNSGTSKYYVPYEAKSTYASVKVGRFDGGFFNSVLVAGTYRYIGIYGVKII